MVVDLKETIGDIVARLDKFGVSYAFTGGVAAIHYGEPRTTQDVDVVIQISSKEDIENLILAFSDDYDFDEESLRSAAQNRDMAQTFHQERFAKVDLHFGELVPGEFQRVQKTELFVGVNAPIFSREDALLSKLLWIQMGSHRSKRDAVAMLRNSAPIDRSFVERMAAELGVSEILREVEVLARGESTERP
ncbi:MAG: hypothetical protein QM758_17670 [Armatimonas sp.]